MFCCREKFKNPIIYLRLDRMVDVPNIPGLGSSCNNPSISALMEVEADGPAWSKVQSISPNKKASTIWTKTKKTLLKIWTQNKKDLDRCISFFLDYMSGSEKSLWGST